MADRIFRINSAVDAKNFARFFAKGLSKPIDNAKPYFIVLGGLIDQDTQTQFKQLGLYLKNT